jgi:hypothetical protein
MSLTFDLEEVPRRRLRSGERRDVAVVVDRPIPGVPDHDAWRERRVMAGAWREGLARLGARIGFATMPLVSFPTTGRNGADFPRG